MTFYFVMNRSAQYLDENHLWTDEWTRAKRTITVPSYDSTLIGYYEIFSIEDVDCVGTQRPIKMTKIPHRDAIFLRDYGMKEAELDRITDAIKLCDPKKREAVINEMAAMAEKYRPEPFKPTVHYNKTGDMLEVYLTDDTSYADMLGPKAPGLAVMRSMVDNTKITGFKISQFIERMSGSDPSVHAMMIDLEFVHTLCDIYEVKIDQHNGAWTWKPEELAFFRKVQVIWPGLKYNFLMDITP